MTHDLMLKPNVTYRESDLTQRKEEKCPELCSLAPSLQILSLRLLRMEMNVHQRR